MKTKITSLLAFVLVLLIAISCSNTQIISSWLQTEKNTKSIRPELNRLMVITLLGDKYIPLQQQAENIIVQQLATVGIKAYSSLSVFGPKRFQGMANPEIEALLHDSSYSAVILVSILDKKDQQSYQPGTSFLAPTYIGSGWGWRYGVIYTQSYTPGYYVNNTDYILGCDIYNLKNDALLYSAQTSTIDPENVANLTTGFIQAIINDLQNKGGL